MKELFRYRAYEMASIVQESVERGGAYIEMPWENFPAIFMCLREPKKITLLHYYIAAVISVYFRRHYRKNSDMMEREDIEYIEEGFETYGIPFKSFNDFEAEKNYNTDGNEDSEDLSEAFYEWFDEQHETAFMTLWEHMTEEVFYILFANRDFLLKFNEGLSHHLKDEVPVPKEYLTEKGVLQRCTYFPKWLKNAVYLRDHGRCSICSKDVTGLIATDYQVHFDHIVPLAKWGTNDASNIQLLCDVCNRSKSDKDGVTSAWYPVWWE